MEVLGFVPQSPSIMQDPIDNTTEILVASDKFPSSELHVWKYYQNQTKPAFSEKYTIKTPGISFSDFRPLHVKDQGLMAVLLSEDKKTLSGVYRDSYDQSFQQYLFDISKQSETLKTKVEYVMNLQCLYIDEGVGFNYECVFFGNGQEIFYIYGDFKIERSTTEDLRVHGGVSNS